MTRALASISSSGSIVSCMTPMRNGTATRLTSSLSPAVARLKPYTSLTCHGRPAPAVTSADARQRVADQHVDDPRPAERRVEYDEAPRLVAGRRVAPEVDLEREIAAGDHDGHPVVAERPGDEDAVARPDLLRAEPDPVAEGADPGCHAGQAVRTPPLDDLRVAGDDRDAGRSCGPAHRGRDPPQAGDREGLLDHEPGREPQGAGAGPGGIVCGTGDRP